MQFVVQTAQPAAQFFSHFGVQRAKGLVQQQHFGLYGQGARQRDPLALPA